MKRLTLEDRIACQIAFECGRFDTAAEYLANYDHHYAKQYRERARRIIALCATSTELRAPALEAKES